MARGKFITLEGGEGVGKSTQARRLCDRLSENGIKTVQTREPGGTPGAEIVRHLLKSGAVEPLGPFAETVMLAAARSEHVDQLIRPALEGGDWVVCDRFSDSTRAYQGAGGGVSAALLDTLETITLGDTRPDLTLILDAPPELAAGRMAQRAEDKGEQAASDRFEKQSAPFHAKLRAAFLKIAKAEPERCVVVDAARTPDEVAEAIWNAVAERLDP